MIVYANGCSFGLPKGKPPICYGSAIADHFGARLINKHIEGSCNRRIIRSSLRDLIDLTTHTDEHILVLIGLSFIFRTELWQPEIPAVDNDGNFHPINTAQRIWGKKQDYYIGDIEKECQYTDLEVRDWHKQHLLWQSKESQVTEHLVDLTMFSAFCRQHRLKYLIWNNADFWPAHPDVDRTDKFIAPFYNYLLSDTNFIDPWEFAFLPWALDQGLEPVDADVYGDYGHPGPEAHLKLAQFLLERLSKRNPT